MKIQYRPPTVSEYKRLRNDVGWWATDENATAVALKNSLFSVIALELDAVSGFGRIVGDGGLYYYIQDLMIHPNFQNKGLGNSLMKELMDYIAANAKQGAFIGLMAGKGLEKYYIKFGFKARDKDAPGMYHVVRF